MIENFKPIFERIRRHYVHAIEKHPRFCKRLIPDHGNYHNWINWQVLAENAKASLKFSENVDESDAGQVMKAELYEVYAAVMKGDWAQAEYEIYDAIAVLLRMLDMIREAEEQQ